MSPDANDPLEPLDADSTWSRRLATHLLWRTQFGAGPEEIERASHEGLDATLERLLSPQPENAAFTAAADLLRRTAEDTGQVADLKAWWLYRMVHSANPLLEKMAVFWHGHFATSFAKVKSVRHMAAQNDLIRLHALGSFRDLLHGMARDVAMLIWLDGNANRKRHPNENFAREVMELFSLGEGNYTERDIREAARAFSGWHVRNGAFWLNRVQHDDGTKQVLGRTGRFDGDGVVAICLDQPACARFLARKLLAFFVLPDPPAALVGRLAASLGTHDYAMRPVLRELFSSRAFFEEAPHAVVKGPLDLVLGAQRALGASSQLPNTVRLLADLGQDVFEPPTVKGWEGGRMWISSATLLQRAAFAAELAGGSRYGAISDPEQTALRLGWSRPEQPVDYHVELLLSRDLDPAARERLVHAFRQMQGSRGVRLRGLIQLIASLPEFQQM